MKYLLALVIALLIGLIEARVQVDDLQSRIAELECVHYVYEDGSAVHQDAEIAATCLPEPAGS